MPRPRMPATTAAVCVLALAATRVVANPVVRRASPTWEGGYYNPTSNGGQWLTAARDTYPAGLGEPINVVISSESDGVLMFDEGFFDYSQSLQFSASCLGQSGGLEQEANLGDGNGMHNQSGLLRENFGDPGFGTCRETFEGGYHYRFWRQNGTAANSGAWFLAASQEQDLAAQHDITPNGYDIGRDEVVRRAVASGGTKSPLTNRTFTATARNASGIGYYANVSTSEINHGVGTDGVVMILTVKVTSNGSAPSLGASSSGASQTLVPSRFTLAQLLGTAALTLFAVGILV
ncbi:hypothetical protein BMF94_1851 [Rhodotorula taiwanensis]|uniref:Uncharacterized protein n=1 Tax=Rhodotorula taiwanensis TaxID=741276 RepID=A0A2S5BEM5_9BASI|nr:hypothetical protein BMF94_1851 [Rhodotorula taiwanensis]